MDSAKCWRRRRRPITSLVLVLCFSATGSAWPQGEAADEGAVALLDAFVAEVGDLSAGFEQQRFDENGEPVEEISTGRFTLLRPDRLRLHYDAPYEQIIVADGEWLWKYEVDLEQVDRRPSSDLAQSPVMLLSGAEDLRDNYAIEELPPADGMRWLELTPRDVDKSDFVSARLGFVDSVPVVLELLDGLGELTRVAFTDVEINTGLTDDDFDFDPPRGVMVVGPDD